MNGIGRTVRDYGRMVRFTHSIFALPFALASAAFASLSVAITVRQVLWILVAMVAARNAAMGFNRLADAAIDARNPRTTTREIPRGVLFFLGLALAVAPVGAWIAITGSVAWPPVLLGAAVLAWVAGFDIIYALQDIDFDRTEGLHSIPERFGPSRSLLFARILHAGSVAALAGIYPLLPLHPVYFAGVLAVAAILVYEHTLVRPDDLSKVNVAFFTTNGIVSVVYLATAALAAALRR